MKKTGTATTLIECHYMAASPYRSAVGFMWMKITNNIMITFKAFSEWDCVVVLESVIEFIFIGFLFCS